MGRRSPKTQQSKFGLPVAIRKRNCFLPIRGRNSRQSQSCRGCASGIHPFLARINSPPRVCDVPGADESVRKLAAGQLYENYQIADNLLAGREYFFDHFTAADAHFFWCFRRGTQFELDLSKYKSCQAHFERLQKRPSVQQMTAVLTPCGSSMESL